jgi:hypothetical protein
MFAAKQRQASQWPKAVHQRKANITMAKSHKPNKGKHYNGKKLMFAFLWFTAFGHCDVCLSLDYGSWPL